MVVGSLVRKIEITKGGVIKMAYRINTNISSLTAQRFLNKTSDEQSKTLNRLSTGSRINRSADDAAGLAIGEQLKGSIRSSRQAVRNTSDAVSLIQVAEGGLNELTNILIRLRELSIQSSSDTLSNKERSLSDIEFQQLTKELDRISSVTRFNGKNLLDGSGEKYEFQVGIKNDSFLDRIHFDSQRIDVTASSLDIDGLNVSKKENARDSLEKIDQAMSKIVEGRAELGAIHNRLTSASKNLEISIENQSEAKSRIMDTDYAVESSNNVRNNILVQTGTAVLAQTNLASQSALKLIG